MEKLENAIIKNGKGFYFVEENETLSTVAEKFSTTERVIFVENSLKNQEISGKILYIRTFKKIYKVDVFDTIETVCEKFKISKEIFKKINYVDYVFCGQRVIVDENV